MSASQIKKKINVFLYCHFLLVSITENQFVIFVCLNKEKKIYCFVCLFLFQTKVLVIGINRQSAAVKSKKQIHLLLTCPRQIKPFLVMTYNLIDLDKKQSHLFSCKTDLSRFVGRSTKTILMWQKQANLKRFKNYLICFDVSAHKATQKANNSF